MTKLSDSSEKMPQPFEKALIIVETPFQLLCAYEMISQYRLDYTLIIRMTGVGRNDDQLRTTVAILGLKHKEVVAHVKMLGRNMLRAWPKLLPVLAKRYHHLFVGSYFSRFIMMLSRFVRADNSWIMDDGLSTFRIQAEMVKKGKLFNMATCFELPARSGQTVLHHRLAAVKDMCETKYTDQSLFIGQPLVEMGLLSESSYDQILEACCKTTPCRMTYIPHRVEDSKRIADLKDKFDLKIYYPPICIELDIVHSGEIPRHVFSVMSTAAFTIARMFEQTSVVIYPVYSTKGAEAASQNLEIIAYARTISNMKVLQLPSEPLPVGGIASRPA